MMKRPNEPHSSPFGLQSLRHGFAVPPPFTQGRLWRVPLFHRAKIPRRSPAKHTRSPDDVSSGLLFLSIYFLSARQSIVTSWTLVQVSFGAKREGVLPVVMPLAAAQATAASQ